MPELVTRLLILAGKVWLRLLSPSTMRVLSPLLGLAIVVAGWCLCSLADRSSLGRALRWWVAAISGALFSTAILYQLAVVPDDPDARAIAREALADGLATRFPPSLALAGALAVGVATVVVAWRWRLARYTPRERAEIAGAWRAATRWRRPLGGIVLALALAVVGAATVAGAGASQIPAMATAPGTVPASLWVGTSVGLSRLVESRQGAHWEGLTRPRVPLPASHVTGIAAGPGGDVWIATHGGLARYTDADSAPQWETATVENAGLPYPTVLGLAVDRRGVAWAATGAGGAMIEGRPSGGRSSAGLSRESFTRSTAAFTSLNAPLMHQVLDAVHVDPQGRVWFAGAGGVNVYRPAAPERSGEWLTGFNRYSTGGALPADQVNTIFQGGDGRVWFGTATGVAAFSPASEEFGLGAFDPAHWQTFAPPAAPLRGDAAVHAIAQDRRGRIYLGTEHGIVVLDESQTDLSRRWGHIGVDTAGGLPHPWVQALTVGTDGRLWAGTRGGLAVYDPDRPLAGWQSYRAHPLRRWTGHLWPAHWEQNIIGDDVTALAWTTP